MPLTPFQKEVLGVAFVDNDGGPGWIRTNPALHIHHPSLRGCWPTMCL